MKIFVDTSAFVAIENDEELNYFLAQSILEKVDSSKATLVTSNYVIAETLTVLSQRVSKKVAIKFQEEDVPALEVIRIEKSTEEVAFEIFKKLDSKNVSFVDCTSFALMKQFGITTAFTFDKDFKKQGFKLLD